MRHCTSTTLTSVLLLAGMLLGVFLTESYAQTPTLLDAPDIAGTYQQTITARDLAAHLYFIASDFFEGRETTARGQKMAAWYLASQYHKLGLAPLGTRPREDKNDPRNYFQPYALKEQKLQESTLTVFRNGENIARSVYGQHRVDGHSLLRIPTDSSREGSVVFAGFGISDQSLGYDDYAALEAEGIDLTGKWILVLEGEPVDAEGKSLLTPDGSLSPWSTRWWRKYTAALAGERQPAGLLVVHDVGPLGKDVAEEARKRARALRGVGSLSLPDATPSRRPSRMPMYYISKELANTLLASSGQKAETLFEQITHIRKPVVFELLGTTIRSDITLSTRMVEAENVLAFIEGSDPALKEEAVILSAHYDHVGVSPLVEGDSIFNGADDDGSGTVTLLEIAEAFARAAADGYGPRRTVIFLHVSGEEKGLLGSRYYTDEEPVWPLEKTVANLNIDMIGRHDPTRPSPNTNYVYIIGSRLISQDLHEIALAVNQKSDLHLELDERFNSKDDPNRFYRRSDHWNFGKHNIPFIFFFTGTHEDYHRPGDEPHKIDYERMARIGRLIMGIAWQVANQDERPRVTGTGFN